ncbi:MAG: metal transporter substrate-binding protein [Rhodospirillales bacterium]|nr:metal transporter substrate-binding protein [Rhodospirillales bacterium]
MRRTLTAVAVACLTALASLPAQADTKIKLGYTAVADYASAFIAKDQGFFAKHGLDVEFISIAINSNLPSALLSDSIEVGLPTPSVFLQANDGGLDLVIIGGAAVTDPASSNRAVLARPDSGIRTAQDFVGKTVGAPGLGALLHVLFREWLTEKGVDYKRVNFVEIGLPQLSDTLRAGTIDAGIATDPFMSRVVTGGTGYVVSNFVAELPPGISTAFFATTRDWARKNAATVKAFQDALLEAVDYDAKNPEAWRPIVGKFIKLPPDVLATVQHPKLQLEVTSQQVDYWAGVMARQAMLNAKPDAATLIIRR